MWLAHVHVLPSLSCYQFDCGKLVVSAACCFSSGCCCHDGVVPAKVSQPIALVALLKIAGPPEVFKLFEAWLRLQHMLLLHEPGTGCQLCALVNGLHIKCVLHGIACYNSASNPIISLLLAGCFTVSLAATTMCSTQPCSLES